MKNLYEVYGAQISEPPLVLSITMSVRYGHCIVWAQHLPLILLRHYGAI